MPLRSLPIKSTYSSEESSLLHDFYLPALATSVRYDRAVGYFSAEMLSFAAQGVSGLVKRQGKMRLLVGDPLDPAEYEAVKRGRQLKELHARISAQLGLILDNADHPLFKNRLELLSWLVASDRLEIKIGLVSRGLYHEKIGILEDEVGDKLVFQGSANETVAALTPDFNFESIAIYPSWKPEIFAEYGRPYLERFERLWSGTAKNVVTIDLPSAAYESLRAYYNKDSPPSLELELRQPRVLADDEKPGVPRIPDVLNGRPYELMGHQRSALGEWRARDYQGILALATGAGKTITALHGAVTLAKWHREVEARNFVLIVAVPYQVLADQWCEVMSNFNIRPIRCYRSRSGWYTDLYQAIADMPISSEPTFLAAVVVNATLAREEFQELINKIDCNDLMFIGDECHHHASPGITAKLPKARYRLGLSATPWSASNQEAKNHLTSFYGGVVATYSLGRALRDEVLTPYNYHFHPVELEDDEAEEYERLSTEIGRLVAIKEQGGRINEDELMHLYLARSRVLGSADQKFVALSVLVRKQGISTHTLFYCGDGSTEGEGEASGARDIERVARALGESGWKTSRFTAEESHLERLRIMHNFRYGNIDAVVAIRVLDEGFDMPTCRQAFLLASSRNERQFIQRRGRILRRTEGKSDATIHDFVVLPARGYRSAAFRSLVQMELERVVEFARFASNRAEVWQEASAIADHYEIDLNAVLLDVEAKEIVVE